MVIVWSIFINYILGLCIDGTQKYHNILPKIFLVIGIIANLFLLIYFKYFNFFASFIDQFLSIFNLSKIGGTTIPMLLGVSFFSFQAISYLIDVYRRDYPAQTSILKFALFKPFSHS